VGVGELRGLWEGVRSTSAGAAAHVVMLMWLAALLVTNSGCRYATSALVAPAAASAAGPGCTCSWGEAVLS
jgi:hypothetical protein